MPDIPLTDDARNEVDKYLQETRSSLLRGITHEIEPHPEHVTGRDVRALIDRTEAREARSGVTLISFQLAIAVASLITAILSSGGYGAERSLVALSVATAAVAGVSAILLVRTYLRHSPGPSRFIPIVRRSRSYAREAELIAILSQIEDSARTYYLRSRGTPERPSLSDVLAALVTDRVWDETDLSTFRNILRTRNELVHRGHIPGRRLDDLDKQASRLGELVLGAAGRVKRRASPSRPAPTAR